MKPWKDVTLTDDYLFSQIMKDEDFCKLFLEMLISKVLYLEAQKEVNLFPQTKGIRMDIYLEGDDEIYNIEMQTVHKTNLVKRMRYYHSAIDVDSLLRGNPYDQLKKSEKAEDPRLRALLQYLSTATVTDEARPIADKVAAFKRLYPEGRPHMKYELDLYDKWCEGKAEGVKEGIEIGENRGLIKGREEGIQQGIQQGRQESMRDIVYAAFEQGLSAEVIASLTHMPMRLKNYVKLPGRELPSNGCIRRGGPHEV